jgi:zona occludens toxin
MQNLLMGPSGGGKSYEACVFHVLPALNKGRKVITNLPVNIDYYEAICPGAAELLEIRRDQGSIRAFSRVEHFGDDWRHPETGSGPLYVIDECHKAFPRGKTDQLVEEWFAEHRHESADVLLITQSYGKISKAIVDNMQLIYRVRKATAFGSNSAYIRKVQDGIRGEVVNETVRRYDAKYFKLYQSHTKGGGEELGASDVKPLWKHWTFKGAAACLLILVFMVPNLDHPFRPKIPEKVQAAPAELPTEQPAAETASSTAEPASETQTDDNHAKGKRAHPWEGYGLHIAAVLHGKREGQDVLKGLMRISQNGQPVATVSFADLTQAGYQLNYHSDCVISLRFDGLDVGYSVCDAPKVGLASKVPGNG